MTASVGRHCIASTKKTNNPAADEGVKRGEPSSRLEFLILSSKGSASASSPVPNRPLVEDLHLIDRDQDPEPYLARIVI